MVDQSKVLSEFDLNKLNLKLFSLSLIFLFSFIFSIEFFKYRVEAAVVTRNIPVTPSLDNPYIIGEYTWLDQNIKQLFPVGNNFTSFGITDQDDEFSTWRLDFSSICQQAQIGSLMVISNSMATETRSDNEDGVLIFAYTNYSGDLSALHYPNYIVNSGYDSRDITAGQIDIGAVRGMTDHRNDSESGLNVNPDKVFNITGDLSVTYNNLNTTTSSVVGVGILHDMSGDTESISTEIAKAYISYDNSLCPNSPPTIETPPLVKLPYSTKATSTVLTGQSFKARDPDEDILAYEIIEGNERGIFSIEKASGDINLLQDSTVAGMYNLKVQVDDGRGGKANAPTVIMVENDTPIVLDSENVLAKTGQNNLLVINYLFSILIFMIITFLSLKLKNNKRRNPL